MEHVVSERDQGSAQTTEGEIAYWRERLAGAPDGIQLPFDHPRPSATQYSAGRVSFELPAALSSRLRLLAEQRRVSLFATLLSGWAMLLGRLSGQDAVVIGVSLIPMTVHLDRNSSVQDLVQRTSAALDEAHAHQAVPFERIANLLRQQGDHVPAIQVQIELHHATSAPRVKTAFHLTLALSDQGERLLGVLEYAVELFARETAERMAASLQLLLEQSVEHPHRPICDLSIMTDAEREQVLYAFNNTTMDHPRERMIHELFEQQVRRNPDAIAVADDRRGLTYAELNGRANQLARHLRGLGVGPDRLVGIFLSRGVDMVACLLAVLKAGGGYVPLDPNYPDERVTYMLQDSSPKVLLTEARLKDRLSDSKSAVLVIDEVCSEIELQPAGDPESNAVEVRPHNIAYVIYTSGSTGRPKGVVIEHRNAVNLICWAQSALPPAAFSRTLQATSLNFDLSVYECFVPLSVGACVRVVENAMAPVASLEGVTLINTVPSAVKGMLDSCRIPRATQVVNLAGEVLRREVVQRLFELGSVRQVNNLYGPSETTTYSTWVSMSRDSGFVATIGRPIANTQIYVLDEQRRPVPIGVVGEIYIGGCGVARGYLNRPDLTAERFIPDPFGVDPQARIYKTGDLGRWRAEGSIEYLGRNDHQVKVRGFRIELGEIEARLAGHPAVREAVLVVREEAAGDKRLIAYVTGRTDYRSLLSVEGLRAQARATLPEYMVPSAFVILERLPLTPSGKLDRRALPIPEFSDYTSMQFEPPEGELEEILAGIWKNVLNVRQVSRQSNLFELGGHSLLIVHVLEQLRRARLFVEVSQVFKCPTLADLASKLTHTTGQEVEIAPSLIPFGCRAITPAMLPLIELGQQHIDDIVRSVPGGAGNVQDVYPLAPLQDGILFHHVLNEDTGDTYVLPMLLSFAARERLDAFIGALQAVIDRHDILRTAMLWDRLPRPVQVVYRKAVLPVEELRLDPDRDPIEHLKRLMAPQAQRMDPRRAPLVRLTVTQDTRGEAWYALLQLHHLVQDHESLETMFAEVVAHIRGQAESLPPPHPYRNHVAHVLQLARSRDADDFFRSKLGDVAESTAPFGVLNVHGDGSRIEAVRRALEPELAHRVGAQARRLGVSAATLFHAAWALVVARTSGRTDVVFGTLLSGRLQGSIGTQRVLGMFINTLPLRLRLQGSTATSLVTQTQRELVELLTYEQASLATAQRCSGVPAGTPLFSSLLNYVHGQPSPLDRELGKDCGIELVASDEWTNYPVVLTVDAQEERFVLTVHTDRQIDPHSMVGYTLTAVQSLVEALEQQSSVAATRLEVIPGSERQLLLGTFNDTSARCPDQSVPDLFAEQVRRTPFAVAVQDPRQSLSFADLSRRSNQLARHLRRLGVGPDELVGLCVERSVDMLVGILGILKAGGAYVPLDPCYPLDRLHGILTDAAPKVLLTQSHLERRLPAATSAIVTLDGDWERIAQEADDDLDSASIGLRPSHLAYVIYTSGSTGTPKGVMIEHRNVVSLWHALGRDVYGRSPPCHRIGVNASFNFDASVKQLVQLLSGRTICLLPQEIRGDATALLAFVQEQQIQGIDCTPSQLKTWLATGLLNEGCPLRIVLIGGEAIEPELWQTLARNDSIEFFNVYGPTECTVDVACARLRDDVSRPHIGRPMENAALYILDGDGETVPIGQTGEICIAGARVGRGYWNRPDWTADRFVANPFDERPAGRLYKSGDLGRWRADGTIEYVGRNDQQVKVRGFRIELAELESRLCRHPLVEQAVVVLREDTPGDKRLVAYVRPRGDRRPAVEDLRIHMSSALPEYMVPSSFVTLTAFPMTPSGKLDRRALPEPGLDARATRPYEPPQGEMEELVACIWQEVLGVERVGRADDFFELGGHSLLAMQVSVRIRSLLSLSIPMRCLFELPTLERLSARVSELREARLREGLADGDRDLEALLETVAAMPDGDAEELLRKLQARVMP